MGRRGRWIVCVALAAATLVACGGDDDGRTDAPGQPSTDAASGAGSDQAEAAGGVYQGELADGSTLVVRLDVAADDPAVAPFEAFRAVTGADEPTWIVGQVTVPEDVDGTGRFVTFLAEGADRLPDDPADRSDGVSNADFACAVMEDWFQGAEVKDQALSDAYMALYDGPCVGQTYQVLAAPGETTTYVMVYDGDLPEFETMEAELGNPLTRA